MDENFRINFMKNFYSNLQKFCAAFLTIVCTFLLLICLTALMKSNEGGVNVLVINTNEKIIRKTDNSYLSIGLDSSVIAEGFIDFQLNNSRLIALTRYLKRGILRVGGTLADRLKFVPIQSKTHESNSINLIGFENCTDQAMCQQKYTLTGDEWLALNTFARNTGFTILFDLNALLRLPNGEWDSQNAEELIKFSDSHKLEVIWQLGNEPNSFQHVFNYSVNASQLAQDYKKLRQILNNYNRYKNTIITGPETTRPQPDNNKSVLYLNEFLENIDDAIDVVSWHQYYMNGRTASFRDFLNPLIFNLLKDQIKIVKNISRKTNKPLWLTETASAYGGGSPGYSDTYIGSFIWLDKLGLAAKEGIDLVVRQSIVHGHYALIDQNYDPNTDWWISVIYKKLVGNELLSYKLEANEKVRLYCHCSSDEIIKIFGSAITIFGMNLNSDPVKLKIQGIADEFKDVHFVETYSITADHTIFSKDIRLNGDLIHLNGDQLPPLISVTENALPYLIIPPFSMIFWVVPNPAFNFCFENL